MGILPPNSPLSSGYAMAVAKGIKKGYVPERSLKSGRPSEERAKPSEQRQHEAPDNGTKPAKRGLLARLSGFFTGG